MNWTKEQLAEHVMCLEHNNNSLQERMDIQFYNIENVLESLEYIGIYVKYNPYATEFSALITTGGIRK